MLNNSHHSHYPALKHKVCSEDCHHTICHDPLRSFCPNGKSKELFSTLRYTPWYVLQSCILQSFHSVWAFMTSHIPVIPECILLTPWALCLASAQQGLFSPCCHDALQLSYSTKKEGFLGSVSCYFSSNFPSSDNARLHSDSQSNLAGYSVASTLAVAVWEDADFFWLKIALLRTCLLWPFPASSDLKQFPELGCQKAVTKLSGAFAVSSPQFLCKKLSLFECNFSIALPLSGSVRNGSVGK